LCSVFAGKTSTPRSAGRIQGRRNLTATQSAPVVSKQKTLPSAEDTPLSPINVHTGPLSPVGLQRTNSGQSSTSGGSGSVSGTGSTSGARLGYNSKSQNDPGTAIPVSRNEAGPVTEVRSPVQRTGSSQSNVSGASGGGSGPGARPGYVRNEPPPISSSRNDPVPVPKPRSSASIQPNNDEIDLGPSRRQDRDPRQKVTPAANQKAQGVRSQSSPADRRVKHSQQGPQPHSSAKTTTPRRNGEVQGRSRWRQPHEVDRSLGSVESPLCAFADRTGLVIDVRSKTAYKRGRLLGKV